MLQVHISGKLLHSDVAFSCLKGRKAGKGKALGDLFSRYTHKSKFRILLAHGIKVKSCDCCKQRLSLGYWCLTHRFV